MASGGQPHIPLRKVAINWDDLEVALTSHSPEWSWALDLRDGAMHVLDLEEEEESGLSREEVEEAFVQGHLVRVDPLESRVEYGWMAEFTETVGDTELRARLEIALDGRGAFRRFKNVLAGHPGERERWFAFRDERLRREMQAWLAEHGIEPMTEPPVRRPSPGGARQEG